MSKLFVKRKQDFYKKRQSFFMEKGIEEVIGQKWRRVNFCNFVRK